MAPLRLGVNLSFAVKRWPEPAAWCRLVRQELGLRTVQYSFDLLDPWYPSPLRAALAGEARAEAASAGIEVHSAFAGLAHYTYNDLLGPNPQARKAALQWWKSAVECAAALGASGIGGPLGGMSVTDASSTARSSLLYEELLESIAQITAFVHEQGLKEFYIEPTPLARELPHTIPQATKLLQDLKGRTQVPVRYALDVGHALFQPLYGTGAQLEPWLYGLGDEIGLIHLQNTDFQSDSHWGWPDARGRLDLESCLRRIAAAGLRETPVFLELIPPFEAEDGAVLANTRSSVEACAEILAGLGG